MARFQVRITKKTKKRKGQKTGFVIIPKDYWMRKGLKQGTYLNIVEGTDGSLIIREV